MICKTKNGFTIIELLIVISVLSILVASGVALFFRSIRGSSQAEVRKTLDERSRLVMSSLTRFLRETKIVSLDAVNRDSCLATGTIAGSSLVVEALDGMTTTISVSTPAGQIASSSGATSVILNPDGTYLIWKVGSTPFFTWDCVNGVPDKLNFKFRAVALGEQGDTSVAADYNLDLVLRNSGR